MLKMTAGDPGNQVLILGLSFRNLDEFKNKLNDTYIRIKGEDVRLSVDVILSSGQSMRVLGSERPSGKTIFMISLGMDELNRLRENPGRCLIRFDKETYKIPMNVLIFSGVTEQQMTEQVAELIGPETEVTMDARFKH